jgi:hypothetical protein
MYLMMYVDEAGKVVYTLKARSRSSAAQQRSAWRMARLSVRALTLGAAAPLLRRRRARTASPRSLRTRRASPPTTSSRGCGAHTQCSRLSRALTLLRPLPCQERVTCKKRFNLLPTQKPAVPM